MSMEVCMDLPFHNIIINPFSCNVKWDNGCGKYKAHFVRCLRLLIILSVGMLDIACIR